MAKKKIIALFVMAALLVTAALPVLVACNDKADVTGKGVERPENIFTDDIDTVDSDNLAAGAQVTVTSAEENASVLIDGDKDTAWTAENATGESILLSFGKTVTVNTVVLRENGNLKHMTTSQDIELLLPNEDADFLAYNVVNFPDLVMEFFETHKLSIPIDTDDLSLTIIINAEDEFAEGIGLTANVSSEADYALLSSDVTFEQIAEDYADHVGSVRV